MSTLSDLVARHYRQLNTWNFADAAEVFVPDLVTVFAGHPALTGIDALIAFGQTFKDAFPDMRIAADATIESADAIAVEGRFTGTHTGVLRDPAGEIPATGRAVEVAFVDIFRARDGRVAIHHIHLDQLGMLTQLGLAPAPAAQPA